MHAERYSLCCLQFSSAYSIMWEHIPGMADAYYVVDITQCKFQQLIRKYTGGVREPKERMIRKDSPQPHCPCVQDGLIAQTAKTDMAVDNLNPFSQDYIPEYGKERKDGRKGRFPVYDEERDVVDLKAIGEISNAGPAGVCMSDDDYFVPAVDQFLL